MASSTDYVQEYGQAEKAYLQGSYREAATIIDRLIEDYPNDPSARLLRGHIYCYGLQQYDIAQEQYEMVLTLTSEPDFIDYANNGLEYAKQCQNEVVSSDFVSLPEDFEANYQDISEIEDFHEAPTYENWQESESVEESDNFDLGSLNFDEEGSGDFSPPSFDDEGSDDFPSLSEGRSFDPFGSSDFEYGGTEPSFAVDDDPFTFGAEGEENDDFETLETHSNDFDGVVSDFDGTDLEDSGGEEFFNDNDHSPDETGVTFVIPPREELEEDEEYDSISEPYDFQFPYEDDLSDEEREASFPGDQARSDRPSAYPTFEDETLLMDSGELENKLSRNRDDLDYDSDEGVTPGESFPQNDYLQDDQTFDQNGFNSQEHFDFVTFDEAFGSDSFAMEEVTESQEDSFSGIESRPSAREGFLDEFDVFDDDLGSIPDFSLGDQEGIPRDSVDEADFDILSSRGTVPGAIESMGLSESGSSLSSEDEMFSLSTTSEQIPIFNQPKETDSEPVVSVDQGWLAPFENASLNKKTWITAIASGVVSAVMVAIVSFLAASTASAEEKPTIVDHLRKTSGFMTLVAGLAGFGTTLALGRVTTRQIKRSTTDLQNQFDAISQGNLNVNATVYSEDEFGKLATGFNQMARVILTTTSEAQRKAEEQEQAKEDLQRQVIRLLDDVEGAARGDLTVQAEVTADVLGAVADSFNLTIQNLREIVQQVKQAARQVNKGASESETFARSLSSDALRQAEELAVTLNSVQVMTDLIGRVAESAKEAEDVARSASATAIKGGEAVERTVAGILQIRETVAETTRKVKRLAESSQEISKIVAVISTIASRTNLLALNASIEAARAGEAGRGFAIVADEVRQLADRAAKALKEIEQIVLQIQSETGSVMTAMEEGTQQVIEGTRRAEQAKRSLEDIVQVSNRIDALVRSIAADTIEQTETSRAVAQVMQSVELTAQETSQEAQRVSGALQHLVGVARDLLTSVERFRVESNDGK